MGTIEVKVQGDHLARLARSPERGLSEILWNALDADADRVTVFLEPNGLGGVARLSVADDGEGVSLERAEVYFGKLGGSWKSVGGATAKGRAIHGSKGQGRFAAFALGNQVTWTSVAQGVEGRQRVVIRGRAGSGRFNFAVEDVASDVPTGTTVLIEELTTAGASWLDTGRAEDRLSTEFALFLEQYPAVSIVFNGIAVQSGSAQVTKRSVPMQDAPDGAELQVIEWRMPVERALFLTANGLSPLAEIPPGIQAPGFNFTAYLRWEGLADHADTVMLGELSGEPVAGLIEAAKDGLRAYFKERRAQRSGELIQAWKDESTYPLTGEPDTPLRVAERELFDLVATTAAPAIENARPQERKLALRLLLQAVQTGPDALNEILQEVIQLDDQQIRDLNELLQRSSLAHIISAARMITDRLDFLDGLEDVINDRDLRHTVRERDQLHRMIENETWIFGEEYALTVSDRTLRKALRDHKDILGGVELLDDQVEEQAVVDDAGRNIRVDLLLSRVLPTTENRRRHLVVELKRPNVPIGIDEINQIINYADTVADDSRFDHDTSEWSFWIVGDKLDKRGESRANQKGRDPGVVHQPDEATLTVRAVTWANIIGNARHRLSYLQSALNVTSNDTSGRDYLHRRYAESMGLTFTEPVSDQ